MNNDADTIVTNWLSKNKQQQSQNPADAVVNRWLTKQQNPNPHPLDDTSLSVQKAQNAIGDQSYDGLCERFVEQQTYNKTGLFSTAADAWNNYIAEGKANADVSQAPAGSLIYFAPDQSNYGDGHVGIADGQGGFVSATANGVQQMPINDWMSLTGQQPLGFVQP